MNSCLFVLSISTIPSKTPQRLQEEFEQLQTSISKLPGVTAVHVAAISWFKIRNVNHLKINDVFCPVKVHLFKE